MVGANKLFDHRAIKMNKKHCLIPVMVILSFAASRPAFAQGKWSSQSGRDLCQISAVKTRNSDRYDRSPPMSNIPSLRELYAKCMRRERKAIAEAKALARSIASIPGFSPDAYSPAHWTKTGKCAAAVYSVELNRTACVTDVAHKLDSLLLSFRPFDSIPIVRTQFIGVLLREAAIGNDAKRDDYDYIYGSNGYDLRGQKFTYLIPDAAKRAATCHHYLELWKAASLEMKHRRAAELAQAKEERQRRKPAQEEAGRQTAQAERATRIAIKNRPNHVTLFHITIGQTMGLKQCQDERKSALSGGVVSMISGHKHECFINYPLGNSGTQGKRKLIGRNMPTDGENEEYPLPGRIVILSTHQLSEFPWISDQKMFIWGIDGRVEKLRLSTDGIKAQKLILGALVEKFGTYKKDFVSYENAKGVKWKSPIFTWREPSVTITFKYSNEFDRSSGTITAESDAYRNAQEEQLKSKGRL